jgi:hypothetical protein
MASAQRRTLPLFKGIDPAPPKPKRPAVRTLRKRVVDAALAWVRSDPVDLFRNHSALRRATEELNERLKES